MENISLSTVNDALKSYSLGENNHSDVLYNPTDYGIDIMIDGQLIRCLNCVPKTQKYLTNVNPVPARTMINNYIEDAHPVSSIHSSTMKKIPYARQRGLHSSGYNLWKKVQQQRTERKKTRMFKGLKKLKRSGNSIIKKVDTDECLDSDTREYFNYDGLQHTHSAQDHRLDEMTSILNDSASNVFNDSVPRVEYEDLEYSKPTQHKCHMDLECCFRPAKVGYVGGFNCWLSHSDDPVP
jgi:hypothetical protein